MKEHVYRVTTTWTGNLGSGTSDYRAYSRNHEIRGAGKNIALPGSADPAFRGDATRYNPEELLVASLSSCHMLWLLHLCADAGIVVKEYTDQASAVLEESGGGGGKFVSATMRPHMIIDDPARVEDARSLHQRAHELCFVARSVNFPVTVEAIVVAGTQ